MFYNNKTQHNVHIILMPIITEIIMELVAEKDNRLTQTLSCKEQMNTKSWIEIFCSVNVNHITNIQNENIL